ncbi:MULTISPECIES: class III extradiol ring-cleavage dioxygenase [unclassified Paenibacillus]|uniref:dioxygenase family protein n=1 Tax=unclassified Paenibacillus TaxID=185978 RepID=UPI001AE500A9|nr:MULTISPECIES: class III extradiol ring-cleavage dioxygenase [unclassified Paenibacillus]MBP1153320.1 4,5-DOPA dioxygenase extradiol [Paenibacillus sp. PvP091]MBP1171297.1 4,5-DOPA dioxygenase extradiol [Paenibacillus sp. PvR098]MBP2442325.1 4,5-DOPA dioxygenase extradiol [Paenibacillus sp. PvP052]
MLPSFFIGHGAPSLALENNPYTTFLKELASQLPKPKAIVLFSAHWESGELQVSGSAAYETIYDFSGFQNELYQMQYPAPGDLALASEVQALFQKENIPAGIDPVRGLDHGAWVVLHLLYPDADIPVIALSVNRHLTNAEQYRIGRALSSLREKDILIIGSGGTVHNLRRLEWGASHINPWAAEFDQWLEDKLTAWDVESLFRYHEIAPYAKEAVPTPEHFIPLLLAMGSGDSNQKATLLHRSYQYGNLSLSAWKFE